MPDRLMLFPGWALTFIATFLREKKSGKIVIRVEHGAIVKVDAEEEGTER